MREREAGRSRLVRMRRRLSAWRAEHGGRGRPIPTELWEEAVAIARAEGVARTARELGVDRRRLARLVEPEPAPSIGLRVTEERASAAFVELDAQRVLGPVGQAVVHLEGRDGERVRIEVSGASAVDVVALASAFWSRAR